MFALYVIASILAYCVVIGAAWAVFERYFEHDADRAVASAAWPFTMSILLGSLIVSSIAAWLRARRERRELPRADARRSA